MQMSPKSTFYDDPRKAKVFQLICKYANKGELERLINEPNTTLQYDVKLARYHEFKPKLRISGLTHSRLLGTILNCKNGILERYIFHITEFQKEYLFSN